MKADTPVTIYLKDYRKPDFVITHSELHIQLDFKSTRVTATHQVSRNNADAHNLELDCAHTAIEAVELEGVRLNPAQYKLADNKLVISNVPTQFELGIINTIDPSQNTSLSGLYQSGDMLCTQCEAEGYRRITPGIDRPDNLTEYRVKLSACKIDFPILLCNGNLIDNGDIDDGIHFAIWHDPFPKPTYLFAIVAGKLKHLEDRFKTRNGRDVCLRFYVREKDIDKCGHAMTSLKNAMTWDEQTYGREYDLDLFNVVAVDDFNMGAMENKSLNIFNTKYVLADSVMATDTDFDNVESVIGHEYFHNWSGNRVTCRDWFQLSLKEGFTVFRDQEFSADMGSRGVKRIDDVAVLRASQFKEDASPMAHPVRPDSYQEINNFYTATVYNKGAEVVRMIQTLLGAEIFRKGTDLYFDKFDGQAATTDDFVECMEIVGETDLTQFKYWYSQAGTPKVKVETRYDSDNREFEITMKQILPQTPDNAEKHPFVIPIKAALFNQSGKKLPLNYGSDEVVLKLDKREQTFSFSEIPSLPTPSLLRQFSAPVELDIELNDAQLGILLNHDDDPFNRWEAGQRLYIKQWLHNISCIQNKTNIKNNPDLITSFSSLVSSDLDDLTFLAKLLQLPSVAYVSEQLSPTDPKNIELARRDLTRSLATATKPILLECYHQCQEINSGQPVAVEMGARSLRDRCLYYLAELDDQDARDLTQQQLTNSKCMTDEATAIALIAKSDREDKSALLDNFYDRWKNEPLVVDKWLRLQAMVADKSTLSQVKRLTSHPGFDFTNPNKVYALILGFTHGNPYCFHLEDGSGYDFIVHWIRVLDLINPQVSARLVSALNGWRKYHPKLQEKMHHSLNVIAATEDLSRDVQEIVSKNLK